MPEAQRNPHEGGEFDWFMIDQNGHVACCSTAGFGEIPHFLYALGSGNHPLDHIDDVIEALPITGTHSEDGRGPGQCADWPKLGRRGLFTYDWKHWNGPYERIIRPENAVTVDRLPDKVICWMRPVRTSSIRFEEASAFQLADVALEPPA